MKSTAGSVDVRECTVQSRNTALRGHIARTALHEQVQSADRHRQLPRALSLVRLGCRRAPMRTLHLRRLRRQR